MPSPWGLPDWKSPTVKDGKVVAFNPKSPHCGINARPTHVKSKTKKGSPVTEVACGASRLVDVEFGRGERLYALSQGHRYCGDPGSPAEPNTDALVEGNENGIQGLRSGDIITLVQHRVSAERLTPKFRVG